MTETRTGWLLFATHAEADAWQAEKAVDLGLGQPGMTTTRWAEPRLTVTGKWAVPTADGSGVAEPAWPEPPAP